MELRSFFSTGDQVKVNTCFFKKNVHDVKIKKMLSKLHQLTQTADYRKAEILKKLSQKIELFWKHWVQIERVLCSPNVIYGWLSTSKFFKWVVSKKMSIFFYVVLFRLFFSDYYLR